MSWVEVNKQQLIKSLKKDLPDIDLINNLKGEHQLASSSMPHEVVSVNNQLYKIFTKLKKITLQPYYLGRAVGDTNDFKKHRLSLQFIEQFKDSLPSIVVNQKAEQLFLYSRNIWSDSIISVKGEVDSPCLTLVYNEQGDFLGAGFAMTDDLTGMGKREVIKNLVDIGKYLRVEREK